MFCIKNLIIIKEESIIVLLIIAVEMLKIQFSWALIQRREVGKLILIGWAMSISLFDHAAILIQVPKYYRLLIWVRQFFWIWKWPYFLNIIHLFQRQSIINILSMKVFLLNSFDHSLFRCVDSRFNSFQYL